MDCGGVPTNQLPPSARSSLTAQESPFSPPLNPSALPRPVNLGLPTDHLPPRRSSSRPSPAQQLPPVWATSPLVLGEPSLMPGHPGSSLLALERFLHVSPDPSRLFRRMASTGVTWTMICCPPPLTVVVRGESFFSQLSSVTASSVGPRSRSGPFLPGITRLSTFCRCSCELCIAVC